jgi:hypothetical protein
VAKRASGGTKEALAREISHSSKYPGASLSSVMGTGGRLYSERGVGGLWPGLKHEGTVRETVPQREKKERGRAELDTAPKGCKDPRHYSSSFGDECICM